MSFLLSKIKNLTSKTADFFIVITIISVAASLYSYICQNTASYLHNATKPTVNYTIITDIEQEELLSSPIGNLLEQFNKNQYTITTQISTTSSADLLIVKDEAILLKKDNLQPLDPIVLKINSLSDFDSTNIVKIKCKNTDYFLAATNNSLNFNTSRTFIIDSASICATK